MYFSVYKQREGNCFLGFGLLTQYIRETLNIFLRSFHILFLKEMFRKFGKYKHVAGAIIGTLSSELCIQWKVRFNSKY